jgi:hypothetical protein
MCGFPMSIMNMIGKLKTKMPKFQVNVYVKEILITSYYVDADDRYDALDKGNDMIQDDLYLDIEESED